jgi:hypothetical protein
MKVSNSIKNAEKILTFDHVEINDLEYRRYFRKGYFTRYFQILF